jgi:Rieske 2Fe-2S family protein
MTAYQRTTATYRPGATTLPRERYTSEAILAEERERIFARGWNCVGRASRLAQSHDFFLCEVAGESVIVLRDQGGTPRAFFNVCRHRGTRICREESGRFGATIQCSYHAWTYSTDGRLVGAPHMQGVAGFDKADYPLHAAALAEWEGFLFVNVAERPAPFASAWAPLGTRFARFGLAGLTVGHRVTYDVRANWKLLFQNYSECLHCPTIHPKLATVLPYQSGANDLVEGPFLGGYMEIRAPNESATMSGRACGRLVSEDLPEEDRKRGFYYSLMPNMLLSLHPDYVNYYRLRPVAVDRTVVESEWLFHPDTLSDLGSNVRDAIEFWDLTNRQDWDIVEQSQLGIASRRYGPGPYSPRESVPAAWDREYLRQMSLPSSPTVS